MGKKLIGLLESPTGIIHALKEGSNHKGFCGFQSADNGSAPYSGANHITCKRCYQLMPSDIFGKDK